MDVIHSLPKNLQAERAILSSFLLRPEEVVSEFCPRLNPSIFYDTRHRTIAEAITAVIDAGAMPDIVLVSNHLKEQGRRDSAGGALYLSDLLESFVTSAGVEQYLSIVEEDALRRKLIEKSEMLAAAASQERYAIGELETITQSIGRALATHGNAPLTWVGEEIDSTLLQMEKVLEGGTAGIPTGFRDLDKLLHGMVPGLYILAGRPSTGKTTLALNMAIQQAGRIKPGGKIVKVGFISLESTRESLNRRLLSYQLGRDWSMVPAGSTRQEWKQAWRSAAAHIATKPIAIDDRPMTSANDIVRTSYEMKLKHDIDVIYIDYLQLLSGNENSREQEIATISRRLARLNKELEIPFVVLSQLNRKIEERGDAIPRNSDLRESGAIEQDADVVMFTVNPAQYGQKESPHFVYVTKNREGATGRIPLYWKKEAYKFHDYASDDS